MATENSTHAIAFQPNGWDPLCIRARESLYRWYCFCWSNIHCISSFDFLLFSVVFHFMSCLLSLLPSSSLRWCFCGVLSLQLFQNFTSFGKNSVCSGSRLSYFTIHSHTISTQPFLNIKGSHLSENWMQMFQAAKWRYFSMHLIHISMEHFINGPKNHNKQT